MTTAVRQVLDTWVERLNRGDIDAVVAMYADDAVLLPTFAAETADTAASIRAYFEGLGRLDHLAVRVDDASVREHGMGITGLYTFAHRKAGAPVTLPSRFTFVVAPDRERPILHHHSSRVPD